MKGRYYHLAIATIALLLCSCNKDEAVVSFKASTEKYCISKVGTPDVKTYLYSNGSTDICCWNPSNTDSVKINGGTYTVQTSGSNAHINGVTSAAEYYAVYPATIVNGASAGSTTVVDIPTREEYTTAIINGTRRQIINNPMAAYTSSGGSLDFRNLCGLLAFNITGSGRLDSIKIISPNCGLSGRYNITFDGGTHIPSLSAVTTKSTKCLCNINTTLDATPKTFFLNMVPVSDPSAEFTIHIFVTNAGQTQQYRYSRTLTGARVRVSNIIDLSQLNLTGAAVADWNLTTYQRGDKEDLPILLNSWPSSFTDGKYYKLQDNFTLLSGTSIASFAAHLDGGNHHISTTSPLFHALANGASVKHLKIRGYMSTNRGKMGAIADSVLNDATVTIDDCHIEAPMTAYTSRVYLGGLIGYAKPYSNILITNCSNRGTLTGHTTTSNNIVGGLIGYASSNATVTVRNSYMHGSINTINDTEGSSYTGGIIGAYNSTSTFENCYAFMETLTGMYKGGIIGNSNGPTTLIRCYFYFSGCSASGWQGNTGGSHFLTGTSEIYERALNEDGTHYQYNSTTYSLCASLNNWVKASSGNYLGWKNGKVRSDSENAVIFTTQEDIAP